MVAEEEISIAGIVRISFLKNVLSSALGVERNRGWKSGDWEPIWGNVQQQQWNPQLEMQKVVNDKDGAGRDIIWPRKSACSIEKPCHVY
jgi:hypothetical protein